MAVAAYGGPCAPYELDAQMLQTQVFDRWPRSIVQRSCGPAVPETICYNGVRPVSVTLRRPPTAPLAALSHAGAVASV